jgi:hypothetical protein
MLSLVVISLERGLGALKKKKEKKKRKNKRKRTNVPLKKKIH